MPFNSFNLFLKLSSMEYIELSFSKVADISLLYEIENVINENVE